MRLQRIIVVEKVDAHERPIRTLFREVDDDHARVSAPSVERVNAALRGEIKTEMEIETWPAASTQSSGGLKELVGKVTSFMRRRLSKNERT